MEKSKIMFRTAIFFCKLFAVCLIAGAVMFFMVYPPKYGDFVLVRNVLRFLFFIAFGILAVVLGIIGKTNDSSVVKVSIVLFGFAVIYMAVFDEGNVVKDIFSQETRQVVLNNCTYVFEESGGRYSHIEYYLCGESEDRKWKFEVTGIDTNILVKLTNESVSARVTYYPNSRLVKCVEIIEW